MNLMGKIFTLLILLLSICFFVIALMVGASHTNWKTKAQEMSNLAIQQSNSRKAAIAEQASKEEKFRAEQVTRALQISALEAQLETLRQDLARSREVEQTASQDKDEYQNRLREAEGRLTKLDQDIERLNSLKTELLDRVVTTKNDVVGLTNQKFNLENQVELLKTREANLAERASKLLKVTKMRGIDPDAPVVDVKPRIDGLVEKVDRRNSLIIFNLGSDDNLRKGHTVDIHRDGRYVGQAEIVETKPNLASARLISGMMQKQVQEGDNVTTKF